MNTSIFYAASIVASTAGLYLLWTLGFQPLFVDEFRDSLFILRSRLYNMAASGRLSPNATAYRTLERLINGLIRFAHLFNLTFLVTNHLEFKSRPVQDDPELDIAQAIKTVEDAQVRLELTEMELDIKRLVVSQMMRASLPMIFLSRAIVPLSKKDESSRAVKAFETEAYNAYPANVETSGVMAAI